MGEPLHKTLPNKYDIFVRQYEDPTVPVTTLTVDSDLTLEALHQRLLKKVPEIN